MGTLPLLLLALGASAARADEVPARCRALRAEAAANASLLRWPKLEAQALRTPQAGDPALSGVPATTSQLRAGVAFSVVDVFRADALTDAAEAECERHLARQAVLSVLQQGAAFGRADALAAQVSLLKSRLPRADELVAEAKKRLERGLDTVVDFDAVRLRRLGLDTSLGALEDELALLRADDPGPVGAPLEELGRYARASLDVEREKGRERSLGAFQLDVRAGATPVPSPDWFGLVTLGWNTGAPAQQVHESELMSARTDELAGDRDELGARWDRFAAAMRDSAARLGDELQRLDRELAIYAERLAPPPPDSDSERLRRTLAPLEMARMETEARRAFVERLRAARAAVGGMTR